MAISRVPGFSLLSNLDRQGVDLRFTTNGSTLSYLDFSNFRFGINTTSPQQTLDVNGNILVSNGHIFTSTDRSYDIGSIDTYFRRVYTANLIADSITISGNIEITGGQTGGNIYAEALFDSNHRVLTTNTTFLTTGDAIASGVYDNIILTLSNTSVVSGTYGSNTTIPTFVVDQKGRLISAANVTLTKVGNITITDTTISSSGNISFAPESGYIFANDNIISNIGNPLQSQDAVSLNYLDLRLTGITPGNLFANSTFVSINTSTGYIDTIVNGVLVSTTSDLGVSFYPNVSIGNLTFSDTTISSLGNIYLNADSTGIVQILGTDALGIPAGDSIDRPVDPKLGYIRFNTDTASLEYWDGTSWTFPGASTISSEIITPDGISNTFVISSNLTPDGMLVSINGTMQRPYTAYNTVGNQLVFTEIPQSTDIVEVRSIAAGAVSVSSLSFGPSTKIQLTNGNVNITGAVNVSSDLRVAGNAAISNTYAPTTNNSPGTSGQIAWDSNYLYICIAPNQWKRANISVW